MITHNQINWKILRVFIMHFYRLVRFHTRILFWDSLSVRVSDSGHPVTHASKFCTNKPSHKIYRCMLAWSTQHYTLPRNPTILHRKKFFASAYHPLKTVLSETKLSQSLLIHPRSPHTPSSISKYNSNKNLSRNISLFPSLGLGLGLGLRSNQPIVHNRYTYNSTWLHGLINILFLRSLQVLSH